jgi:hypothetical protein
VATVQTAIINPALRMLGQIGSGESPTPDESADCLIGINAMLEGWKNDGLLAFAREELTLTLADGDGSYTIGTSGDVNTTRPVLILEAWIVDSNISYPVRQISREEYSAIPDKTTESSWPDKFCYEPTIASSLGTILVHPLPNATRTMKLLVRIPVSEFAAVGTTVTLPPGWEEALASNLAIRMAPEFQTSPSPEVVKIARESKAAIKRINTRPLKASTGLEGLVGGHGVSNIEAGY